jgi:hypothetical protein
VIEFDMLDLKYKNRIGETLVIIKQFVVSNEVRNMLIDKSGDVKGRDLVSLITLYKIIMEMGINASELLRMRRKHI